MIGLTRDDKHVYRWNDGEPLPSITTVMKALDKPALVGWAKRETANAAVRSLDTLIEHRSHRQPVMGCSPCDVINPDFWKGPDDAASAWLKRMPGYQRQAAADLGTRVHALVEAYVSGVPYVFADEEQERPYIEGFRQFCEDEQPTFTAVEYMVCNLTERYAGTGDLVCIMRGERWRLDTKSGSDVYEDTGLQLAAAHFAEFVGIPGDPKKYAVPRADRHGVLHLRADGSYAVIPYRVTRDTYEAFLAARRMWDWLQGPAKSIKEAPLERQELERAA